MENETEQTLQQGTQFTTATAHIYNVKIRSLSNYDMSIRLQKTT